uniref:Membrane protein YuiD n=1 Tax=Aegilops tauschii TaxID=37682 RepID=N1QSS6_AEGTA
MTQSSFARRPPPSAALTSPSSSSSWSPPRHGPRRRRALTAASSLHFRPEDVAELAHNKVLIAATVAGVIGQLAKPFTSGRGGGKIDIVRVAAQSGGMPSTHSAAVVAVTTSLALERGFADSIFGMSVVFASIVMYDAQGVRREVGKHARLLNKLWTLREHTTTQVQEDGGGQVNSTSEPLPANREMATELVSVPRDASMSQCSNAAPSSTRTDATRSPRWNSLQSSEPELTELTEEYNRLSESVGHTEAQVTVGALLGFVRPGVTHNALYPVDATF